MNSSNRGARRALKCVAILASLATMFAVPAHSSVPEDHEQTWVARYNGAGNGSDAAASLVVSPDGSKIFVTGSSASTETGSDYGTVAYSASSGAQLWVASYDEGQDKATDLAISPDGSTIFVTGSSEGSGTISDYATVAYSALTGAQVWVARYNSPFGGYDNATALAVSPDGSTVFVTGASWGGGGPYGFLNADYATVAHSAATGALLWVSRYSAPNESFDGATALAVSPDDASVFVTGKSGCSQCYDYVTLSYSVVDGAELWVARYDGPGHAADLPTSLAVSPDGATVFVTGGSASESITETLQYATVAYAASSGAELWVARYGSQDEGGLAKSLGVSPDGSKVFVTGSIINMLGLVTNVTLAYASASGTELWTARYSVPSNDRATSLAISPDGSKVFISGTTGENPEQLERSCRLGNLECRPSDYATIAYSAELGTQLWSSRYDGDGNGYDVSIALAVSPDGMKVYVTGLSLGGESSHDYATLAYESSSCSDNYETWGANAQFLYGTATPASGATAPYVQGVICDVISDEGF